MAEEDPDAPKDERAAMLGTAESSREKMDGTADWERSGREEEVEDDGGGGISIGWKSDTRVRFACEEEEVAIEASRTKGVLPRCDDGGTDPV